MGLWDLLTAGKRTEEIKMAYVGKHVYDNTLSSSQQQEVHTLATENANRYFNPDNVNEIDLKSENERIRFIFYALAIAELEIDHGLPGYQWFYVKNPFMAAIIDDRLWASTKNIVKKQFSIDVIIAK